MGPVIVGTDLGNPATEAVRQAASFAIRGGSGLIVVHVAPDEVFRALETPSVVDALKRRFAPLVEPFGAKAEVLLLAGLPHGAIVRLADERHASLVVVGPSGHNAVDRMLFGSTAEQVVRHAHSPVLVARPSPERGPVVAATDFSEDATLAIRTAAEEARQRQLPLRVVHCLFEPGSSLSMLGPVVMSLPELPDADREELRRAAGETLDTLLRSTNSDGTPIVRFGPPAATIVDEAARTAASLVVVATRGRTGLARIALGSTAEAVVRKAPCSVLAVRGQAK